MVGFGIANASTLDLEVQIGIQALNLLLLTLVLLLGIKVTGADLGGKLISDSDFNKLDATAKEDWKKCDQCQGWAIKTWAHCTDCNKCVPRFDHHCDWMNNCTGGRTYTSFYIMLYIYLIHSLCTVGLIASTFWQAMNEEEQIFGWIWLAISILVCVMELAKSVAITYLIIFYTRVQLMRTSTSQYLLE